MTGIRTLESEENRSCPPENKTKGQLSEQSTSNDASKELLCLTVTFAVSCVSSKNQMCCSGVMVKLQREGRQVKPAGNT